MKTTFNLSHPTGDSVQNKKKTMEVPLEEALDIAGTGRYQAFHCLAMVAMLGAAVLEVIGSSFVLPAAACHMPVPAHLKGLINAIPNIGIIATAPLWGQAADALGRKPVLVATGALAGGVALLAAFMPSLLAFALCKLAASFFLSCPTSLGFAYISEVTPAKRRDLGVIICNGLLMISSSLSSGLAWLVLSFEWSWRLGTFTLHPWRVLTATYALPLILAALWVTQVQESPKFLHSRNKNHQAIEVLSHIYAFNTGRNKGTYPVTSIKRNSEEASKTGGLDSQVVANSAADVGAASNRTRFTVVELLRRPHFKWLALISFLMFSLFTLLNGVYIFTPDTINKVMSEPSATAQEGNLCVLMREFTNQTNSTGAGDDDGNGDGQSEQRCEYVVSSQTCLIMLTTTLVYGVLGTAVTLCPLAKRTLLSATFAGVGGACLLAGLLTNRLVASAAMSALQITAMGIGPLNAYAVHIFPTYLRGSAVGVVMMCGRVGSAVGSSVAGYLLATACEANFYVFAALLFLCSALSLLLPKERAAASTSTPATTAPAGSSSRASLVNHLS